MNKTTNYNLTQWDLSDPVVMADFNRDNLLIDTALAGLGGLINRKDSAQSAALAAAQETLRQADAALDGKITALDTKQTTAITTARRDLNNAINTAKSGLESKLSALDTKTAKALSDAKALLEAEDQRLNGRKLQLDKFVIPYESKNYATKYAYPLPADLVMKDCAAVFLFFTPNTESVMGPGDNIKSTDFPVPSGTHAQFGLLRALGSGWAVGFPMGYGQLPVSMISPSYSSRPFAVSRVSWADFTQFCVEPVSGSEKPKGILTVHVLR